MCVSKKGMSVVQSWSEQWTKDELVQFARDNPSVPRVLGIDPGQCRLGMALIAPDPRHKATIAHEMRFIMLGWVGVCCDWTATNAQASSVVLRALEPHRDLMSYATQVVLERQHKKNGRMKSLATSIIRFVRKRVARGDRMTIMQRDARHKFANIVSLPCPMPREYDDRKDAVFAAVDMQLRQTGAIRWIRFLQTHDEMRRDLCDAVAIAQDAVIAQPGFLMILVRQDCLAVVSAQLMQRRQRNTWHKQRGLGGVRPGISHLLTSSKADDGDDDDDDDVDDEDHAQIDQALVRFADMPHGMMKDLKPDDDADDTRDTSKRRRRASNDDEMKGMSFTQIVSRQK